MNPWILLLVWLASVVAARTLRPGGGYAAFVAVVLGGTYLVWVPLRHEAGPVSAVVALIYLQVATALHFYSLNRARLRPLPFRVLVNWPALWFVGGTWLALPWAVAAPWVDPLPGLWVPFLISAMGFVQSLRAPLRTHRLLLSSEEMGGLSRWRPKEPTAGPTLRVAQLTDPHLGPFMSPARLRRICERIAREDPELVLVTGDFLTMESQREPELVTWSLEPLAALEGRVFACLGNHDLEALDTVEEACRATGIDLLVDELRTVGTQLGDVEILGLDEMWRHDRADPADVLARHGERRESALRLVLLHNPNGFLSLPPPEGSPRLVLSGHTHGGQLGLVSFGLDWTVLRLLTPGRPDFGFFSRGRDRLYVSSGAGHYGFPVRVGVPGEVTFLEIGVE